MPPRARRRPSLTLVRNTGASGGDWWESPEVVAAKGKELGVPERPGESSDSYTLRVLRQSVAHGKARIREIKLSRRLRDLDLSVLKPVDAQMDRNLARCRAALYAGDFDALKVALLEGEEMFQLWRALIHLLDQNAARERARSKGGAKKRASPAEAIVHNYVRELETTRVRRSAWPDAIRKKLAAERHPRTARQVRRILEKLGK